MTDDELLKYLFYTKKIYSINELYKYSKQAHPNITKKIVKEWTDKQQAIQMNNPVKVGSNNFPRYKKQNKYYEVLFTAINTNTRFAYAYYCRNKDTETILNLLKIMESKTIINSISCDSGTEFTNIKFKEYCKDNDIKLYFITGDGHKLGIINRFHRTLKEKLTQHFTAQDTVNWVDAIDDIVYNYNHSVNRGIGIEPYKVNSFIERQIVERAKNKTGQIQSNVITIVVGDKCRIFIEKTIFEDKMVSKYSNQIYEIIKVNKASVVIIKDNKNVNVKKSLIKIVKEVDEPVILQAQKNANINHNIQRRLLKANVDVNNVVEGPRVRRRNARLDD